MKKLSLLLLLPFFMLFACSDDNNEEIEPKQDYTSFVVTNEKNETTTKGCVIGYKDGNTWVRIATLGDIVGNKESKETRVNFDNVKEVSLFIDYTGTDYTNSAVVVMTYTLEKNKKNILKIPYMYDGANIVKKDDPTKYPKE